MKNSLLVKKVSYIVFAFIGLLISTITFAQDKKIDVDISTDKGGGGNFFASPWVWIVGVAIFILLLVALMRGNRREA